MQFSENIASHETWQEWQIEAVLKETNEDLKNLKDLVLSSVENGERLSMLGEVDGKNKEIVVDMKHIDNILKNAVKEKKSFHELYNKNSAGLTFAVQYKLTALGYDLGNVDGLYGDKTHNAVEEFQKKWNKNHPEDHISVDGGAGYETISRLLKFNIKNNNKLDNNIKNKKNLKGFLGQGVKNPIYQDKFTSNFKSPYYLNVPNFNKVNGNKTIINKNKLADDKEKRISIVDKGIDLKKNSVFNRVYKDFYKKIVSGEMDIPDSDWDDIKNIPKNELLKKINEGKLVWKIGPEDQIDLKRWLDGGHTVEGHFYKNGVYGKKFKSGDYKDLEDFIMKLTKEKIGDDI